MSKYLLKITTYIKKNINYKYKECYEASLPKPSDIRNEIYP